MVGSKMALIKKLAKSIKNVLIQELLEDEIQKQKTTTNFSQPTNKENNAYRSALMNYTSEQFMSGSGSEQKIKELENLVTKLNSKVTFLTEKINSFEDKINNLTSLNEELLFTIDQKKDTQDKEDQSTLNSDIKKFGMN
jgi:exonuclease VII small subunit